MLKLDFNNSLQQILCLGAHSDDIEIGCGGTILKLIEMYPDINIYWIVFGAKGEREKEAVESAADFLSSVKHKKIIIKGFKDGFFPYTGADIKLYFEQLKQEVNPDLILTHYQQDLHQDHRLVSELTRNTFRDHLIWEYEIPKYDGDLASPNILVRLSKSIRQQKIDHLMNHFKTQNNKQWFTEETFSAILRIRGIESNSPEQYAEGFYCRKIIF
ncbi:PIG-L family deacetylase [Waterburya agarophytonicola K14]|uniref:PIG-L family deacetylase n=1 Tax=Waterburya agarophytonicola KI4 TaxID=2874699 RepID=A0A964FFC6_9CYAN|nr:PIG-L deacetylase family protein [Waterburya agarophytonicola]MCC0176771.1 PIG-L family deacetylase [Waterburya agarophytonicola KI4]